MTTSQRRALHPFKNIWVTASAGSGKTKVLTDRLLRLMIEGFDPQKLLCLTFTKTGAAEMLQRIQHRLSQWALCPDHLLIQNMSELLETHPTPQQVQRARLLFSLFLENRPPIQTLHSFCQHLLQKFPLEAGISIPFHVLEEQDSLSLWHEVFHQSAKDLPPLLQEPWLRLSQTYSDAQMISHLDELFSKRLFFWHQTKSSLEMSLPQSQSIQENIPGPLLDRLKKVIETTGSVKDWYVFHQLRTIERFSPEYIDVFLTQSCHPRQRVFSAAVEKALPDLSLWIDQEKNHVSKKREHETFLKLMSISKDYLNIFEILLNLYENIKKEKNALDFNDLILKATALIKAPETMGWILFKLDHSIQHLLVDEAQDTSIEQWSLIRGIGEALMATESGSKTIFIVGDPKQSIYSFQRADVTMFHEARSFLKSCATALKTPFEEITLDISFRSTPPLLNILNATFEGRSLAQEPYIPHQSCRALASKGGHVELWPLYKESPSVEQSAITILAQQWAYQIDSWLKNPFFLETQGRLLQPQDIMILMGKRDQLFDTLLSTLQKKNLPIMGQDRLCLQDHIAIQDLLKVAQWVMAPEDDWSLACVLRGSLFGCQEETLYQLARDRGKISLFDRVLFHSDTKQTAKELSDTQTLALFSSPFQFFHTLLYDWGLYERMVGRLGPSIYDPIERFLSAVLSFEKKNGTSLYQCIQAFQAQPIVTKRDMSSDQEIRLMTIHGAKGLEAPVIILPNICQSPGLSDQFYYQPCVWMAPTGAQQSDRTRLFEKERLSKIIEEQERLLYVAMTRAQERLYCSGLSCEKEHGGWHNLLQPAFQKKARPFPWISDVCNAWEGQGYTLSIQGRQESSLKTISPARSVIQLLEKNHSSHFLLDQTIEEKHTKKTSPAYILGQHVHQLLDELPKIDLQQRPAACLLFLKNQGYSSQKSALWTQYVLNVLNTYPLFFEKSAYHEVSIGRYYQQQLKTLRIDHLFIQKEQIALIDYKIDRSVFSSWDNVPTSYQDQLQNYADALHSIFPHHKIHRGLLWVRTATLLWHPFDHPFPFQ